MVRSFNFDILQEEIKTQYNDMRGIAAIDGHEPTYLHQLCTDNGIDPIKHGDVKAGTDSALPVIVGTGRII